MSADQSNKAPWYKEWFGPDYLKLYAYRDQTEAKSQVERLAASIGPLEGKSVLDVACGTGRHVVELRARGANAIGLDLSRALLEYGAGANQNPPLIQADMREVPIVDSTIDVLLSMFTSFGYFATDAENLTVLKEWHRVLKPGGHFFLDYLDRKSTLENLEPRSEVQLEGTTYLLTRTALPDGSAIEKQITVFDEQSPSGRTFVERVRLYQPEQLRTLLTTAGFQIKQFETEHKSPVLDRIESRLYVLSTK